MYKVCVPEVRRKPELVSDLQVKDHFPHGCSQNRTYLSAVAAMAPLLYYAHPRFKSRWT